MNLENILNEVERERRKVLVVKLYKEGLTHKDVEVREGTYESLEALAIAMPDKTIELYEKALSYKLGSGHILRLIKGSIDKIIIGLVPTRPDKAIEFCERYLSYDDGIIQQGAARAVGAIAAVNLDKFFELYEKYEKQINYSANIFYGISPTLRILARANHFDKFIEIYQKGINRGDSGEYKEKIARTIEEFIHTNPEEFIKLYKKMVNHNDTFVSKGTAETLGTLAPVNPEEFIKLYKEGISVEFYKDPKHKPDIKSREIIAKALAALAPVNQSEFIKLYREGLNFMGGDHHGWEVREGTAEALGALAAVNQDEFIKLYKEGINRIYSDDEYRSIAEETAKTLEALAPVNPDEFIKLYKEGMSHNDSGVKVGTAEALWALADVRPKEFLKLFEEGLSFHKGHLDYKLLKALAFADPDRFIRLWRANVGDYFGYYSFSDYKEDRIEGAQFEIMGALEALAPIKPYEYTKLYKEGLKHDYKPIRRATAISLGALALTIKDKVLVPIEDAEYNFLEAYLKSEYIKTKSPILKGKTENEH